MNFPAIDPVALKIGPLAVHWYGVAYVVGILGWWAYTLKVSNRLNLLSKQLIDDYILWAVGGLRRFLLLKSHFREYPHFSRKNLIN